MNTKTAIFRISISISALWLLLFSVGAWRVYDELKMPPVQLSDDDIAECSLTLDAVPTIPRYRPATSAEASSCLAQHLEAAGRLRNRIEEERLSNFLFDILLWGVLPVLVFLAIGAFAGMIWRTMRAYLRWLRHG